MEKMLISFFKKVFCYQHSCPISMATGNLARFSGGHTCKNGSLWQIKAGIELIPLSSNFTAAKGGDFQFQFRLFHLRR